MIAGDKAAARHWMGRAMGGEPDGTGCACAVCGASPYPAGRPASVVFGPNFTDYDLLLGGAVPDVCAGCGGGEARRLAVRLARRRRVTGALRARAAWAAMARRSRKRKEPASAIGMLGGKPSRTQPPLRMGHVAIFEGEPEIVAQVEAAFPGEVVVRRLGDCTALTSRKIDWFRTVLLDASPALRVLCWTDTAQRHASLRAGLCGGGTLYIGTETDTIEWVPSLHRPLVDAVEVLRDHARREHVESGHYPAHVMAALGRAFGPAEAVVAQHRPSTRLDMVLALVRRREAPEESEPMQYPPSMEVAAELLDRLAAASAERARDPMRFWNDIYERRITFAFTKHGTLIEAVGEVMARVGVKAMTSNDKVYAPALRRVHEILEQLDAEQATEVYTTLRRQLPLVLMLRKVRADERRYVQEA